MLTYYSAYKSSLPNYCGAVIASFQLTLHCKRTQDKEKTDNMKKCERKRAAVVLCGISAAIFLSQMWGSETSQAVERKALPQNTVMDQQRLGYYDQKVETSMDLENTISIQENDSANEEIETKEPGGNLLVLTSTALSHIEDKVEEIDRQTGEV